MIQQLAPQGDVPIDKTVTAISTESTERDYQMEIIILVSRSTKKHSGPAKRH